MVSVDRRFVLMGLSGLVLSGCVMPPPDMPALDYAARADGRFMVPAVPIERVPEGLRRQVVPYETDRPVGSIVIEAEQRALYFILEHGYALRYGIAIGREGLGWHGEAEIYRRARWPSWRPTESMIERNPDYAQWADGQPGGPTNPLGARALYLRSLPQGWDQGIRIHGTPSWRSIGRATSNGCFRMINHDVIDLYDRVADGALVLVI